MYDLTRVVVWKPAKNETLTKTQPDNKKSEISANLEMLLQMEKSDAEVGNSYKDQHQQTLVPPK